MALDTMLALGAPDVQAINAYSLGDHGSCVLPAHFYTMAWYDSLAVKGSAFTGQEKLPLDQDIKVYPNPTSGLLNLEMEEPALYTLELTSLSGQRVYSSKIAGSSFRLDLSSFREGIYFLTIRSERFVSTHKVIRY